MTLKHGGGSGSRIILVTALIAAGGLILGCKSDSKQQVPSVPRATPAKLEQSSPPHLGDCPVFPADNIWNTRIDRLPKDPHSDAYLDTIGIEARLHADFGDDPHSGIPYVLIPPDTPAPRIRFQYDSESDHVSYPVPASAPVEGGSRDSGDRHVLLIDPRTCLLYELFEAVQQPDGNWTAGSGIRMDLRSNALRPLGMTSADAAGLPIFPGLVRYEEVEAGEIRHALRFTLPTSQKAFVWPARHRASSDTSPDQPPLGIRLRLRADFDVTKYPRIDRVILTALKQYGMFLADKGSALYVSGAPHRYWDNDYLHELRAIRATDFEVVDESGLQVGPDSGAARQAK